MTEDIRARAKLWPKGRLFEDFHVGQKFEHHWGRTISESDTLHQQTLGSGRIADLQPRSPQ